MIGEFEEGNYYSFPTFGVPGFKIGKFHHLNESTTAEGLDRDCRDEDEAVLRQAVARYFPDANGPTMALTTCMFTNTPDEHFIIDALPGFPNVFVAAGFSATDSSSAAWWAKSWPTWLQRERRTTTFRCSA